MDGQMSLFDFMPTMMVEPEVGEYVSECGAVIPRVMRKGYIGKKVLVDKSTQSLTIFQVGILEDVIPHEGRERSIVYTGSRQRSLITHYPGVEIRECLPWDAYGRKQAQLEEAWREWRRKRGE